MTKNGRMKGSLEASLVALAFGLYAIATVAWGGRGWLLPVASHHGAQIDRMMTYLLFTSGAILLAGHLVLGYFVWRFSGQRRVTKRMSGRKTERRWSFALGVVMALVAEGGVLVLGLPVFDEFYQTPPPSDAVQVEVTGEQFAWNFRYPGSDEKFGRSDPGLITLDNALGLDENDSAARDDLVLLGELFLPVNRAAHLRLRSKDVLHSFFLPHLRVKQDLVPGMTLHIWFRPTRVGTYEVACAELCGFGHFKMRGLLHVVTEEEFDQFLREEPPFLQ
ncbi:MAG: cytochrome c oxidase subunit II [Acidobacteriota bacterium]